MEINKTELHFSSYIRTLRGYFLFLSFAFAFAFVNSIGFPNDCVFAGSADSSIAFSHWLDYLSKNSLSLCISKAWERTNIIFCRTKMAYSLTL